MFERSLGPLLGRPHERRERHARVPLGLLDHVHQLLRQQVNDERPFGRGRGGGRVAAVHMRRRRRRRRRTVTGHDGTSVRHPVHAEPALGPEHRFADLSGRPVAIALGRVLLLVLRLVVRKLILFRRVVGQDAGGQRQRSRGSVRAPGPRGLVPGPAGRAVRREPAARLFAPVRRRVQAVARRLGRDVHQRHPRHVHVLLDAHAQRGADPGRAGRRGRQVPRHPGVLRPVAADQRIVYVLLAVFRLPVAVVRLVSDVAALYAMRKKKKKQYYYAHFVVKNQTETIAHSSACNRVSHQDTLRVWLLRCM